MSPQPSMGRATCPLLCMAALGAAQPCGVFLTTQSTVRPRHSCGLSCGASLLGRRPPPRLSTGLPVTGCFHGSGGCLPWSLMQPGQARTVALRYRPCCWSGASAGSPECARPMECWFFPVLWLRYVGTCVLCPGPLGSCSPVCPLGALCCVCGVLGQLASVHWCARSVRCVACAVSWATWLLFTSVPAWFVVLLVWCPGPLGSCSPVCPRGVLCRAFGVLCHLAPVHSCAGLVCCVACAVSWATWLPFTDVSARYVVSSVRSPWPLGSCSPLCPFGTLLCLCGFLSRLAPVYRCARSVCCVARAVARATWLLFFFLGMAVCRPKCSNKLSSVPGGWQ